MAYHKISVLYVFILVPQKAAISIYRKQFF